MGGTLLGCPAPTVVVLSANGASWSSNTKPQDAEKSLRARAAVAPRRAGNLRIGLVAVGRSRETAFVVVTATAEGNPLAAQDPLRAGDTSVMLVHYC